MPCPPFCKAMYFITLLIYKKTIPLELYAPTVLFVLEYLTKNNVDKGFC